MRSRPLLRLLAVLALALPAPLRAQTGFGSDNSPPTAIFSPTPGSTFTTAQVSVTITWHDATVSRGHDGVRAAPGGRASVERML